MASSYSRRRSSSGGGWCYCLLGFLVLAGVGIFLAVYLTGVDSPLDLLPEDFIPNLEDWFHEDPFNATGPGDAPRWDNKGQGLELELVNALNDRWYSYFNEAVSDWDSGSPDTLTLSTSTSSPDSSCSPIDGVMKVCNGNYGDTRWKGINELIIENDVRILTSVAKMNEYYLTDAATDAQKQYTMCHEIGHGFGLPHTDENFNNKDTGECMDYTVTPSNNMRPGTDNFLFLQELYGTVPGSVSNAAKVPDGDRRMLLNQEFEASNGLPDWVLDAWEDLVPTIEMSENGREHEAGWRLLHRSLHGTIHEMELGGGYAIRAHKLFVPDE